MNKMDAAFMSGVVFGDQQFSLPEFPKLIEEIDMITLNDLERIIFYGNESPQILGGNAISTLLPRVLTELNGKKSLSEICNKLSDYSSNHVIQAINMLYIRGVIEEGKGILDKDIKKIQSTTEGKSSLSFFNRFVDTTRVNKSGYESFSRMNNKYITIITNDVIDDHLHSQFYINKNILDLAEWKRFSQEIFDNDLIIYIGNYDKQANQNLLELNEFCFKNDIPLLMSIYDNQAGYLAYIEKNETPCYNCLLKNYLHRLSSTKNINDYHKKMWINMTSLEIKYRLSRISVGLTADYRYSFKFSDFTSEREKTNFEVSCSCKYNSQLKNAEFSLAALEYDHSVTFPSQHLNGPKGHQVHYSEKNMKISKEFKKYNNSPSYKLPLEIDFSMGKKYSSCFVKVDNPRVIEMRSLAEILRIAAGLKDYDFKTEKKLLRFNPTGGNLGSVDIYVLNRRLREIPKGIFHYAAKTHTLDEVTSLTSTEMREMLEQLGEQNQKIDIALFITSSVGKVFRKYNDFAYKVSCLDAGQVVSQLELTANKNNLELIRINNWNNDYLQSKLGLQLERYEIISSVMALKS